MRLNELPEYNNKKQDASSDQPSRPGREELSRFFESADTNSQLEMRIALKMQDRAQVLDLLEAGGYIPVNNKEAQDPCFKTALGDETTITSEAKPPVYKQPSHFYAGGKQMYKMFRQAFPNLPEHVANDIYNQTSPGTNPDIVNNIKQGVDPKKAFLDYFSGKTLGFAKDPATNLSQADWRKVLLHGRWKQQILTVNPGDFAATSLNRMRSRNFGVNPGENPERIQRQQAAAKGDGSNEPVTIIKTRQGLVLWEGFHRTMSILSLGRNGDDPQKWNKVKLRAWVVEFGSGQSITNEAGGYIPVNNKEAQDPRFKTALTVDIKPGEVQRQAKKMGFTTDPAGVPPLLHKSAAKNTSANKAYNLGLTESIDNDRQITQQDLNGLEAYADRLFAKVGIDVEFTRHFLDRVNDERNLKQIKMAELTRLFKQEFKKWGKKIAQLGPDAEAVMKDMRTDINLPFVLVWDANNQELDLIAKTVMRKDNFRTSNPEFAVESAVTDLEKGLLKFDKISYDPVDRLMKKIAKEYSITPKELHNRFKRKHGLIPDDWAHKKIQEDAGAAAAFFSQFNPEEIKQIAIALGVAIPVLKTMYYTASGLQKIKKAALALFRNKKKNKGPYVIRKKHWSTVESDEHSELAVEDGPLATIQRAIAPKIKRKAYDYAAKTLHDVIQRKKATGQKLVHALEYYAQRVGNSIKGIDYRALTDYYIEQYGTPESYTDLERSVLESGYSLDDLDENFADGKKK